MVLGELPVPGRPTIWITVGQGPTALAVGAGWGCLDVFTLIYPFFPLSPSLWETAQYRLKYCLKGPLNPNQPTTNQLRTGLYGGGAMVLGKLQAPERPIYLNYIVGWLVGCFGFNGPLRQYFSLYRAVSQREREKEERKDR